MSPRIHKPRRYRSRAQVTTGKAPPVAQMALMEAAERAGAKLPDPRHGGISGEETSKLLAGIVDAIVERHAGVQIDGRLRSAAGRRLLEQFRSELVHVWREADERPSASEMLETLEAIESVGRAIVPDDAKQFVDDLAGPGRVRPTRRAR